jgi:hypothetical protein
MHQEVVVALVIGMQRRRICLGRPASNAAIATSCHTSGSGGCACFWDAEEEILSGTARQQCCDNHFLSYIRKWWLRLFLGCSGGKFVRDSPPATLNKPFGQQFPVIRHSKHNPRIHYQDEATKEVNYAARIQMSLLQRFWIDFRLPSLQTWQV